MSDSPNDPNALLEMLNDLDAEAKPIAGEPGTFLRSSPWLRGARFKAYSRDAAGCEAWMKAYQTDVIPYQLSIMPEPIATANPAPAADGATSRPIRIVR